MDRAMRTTLTNRFDAAIEIKNVSTIIARNPHTLTAKQRLRQSKMNAHELLGEVYTVASLIGLIGVLLYHIAA
jgi:hypothetical protein